MVQAAGRLVRVPEPLLAGRGGGAAVTPGDRLRGGMGSAGDGSHAAGAATGPGAGNTAPQGGMSHPGGAAGTDRGGGSAPVDSFRPAIDGGAEGEPDRRGRDRLVPCSGPVCGGWLEDRPLHAGGGAGGVGPSAPGQLFR